MSLTEGTIFFRRTTQITCNKHGPRMAHFQWLKIPTDQLFGPTDNRTSMTQNNCLARFLSLQTYKKFVEKFTSFDHFMQFTSVLKLTLKQFIALIPLQPTMFQNFPRIPTRLAIKIDEPCPSHLVFSHGSLLIWYFHLSSSADSAVVTSISKKILILFFLM